MRRILAGVTITPVKTREIIYSLFKQIRGFLIPVFQCLNGRDMTQRFLRNLLIVDLDVV